MKVVVFGGTGDVGQEIVNKLMEQNHAISVLTRQNKEPNEKVNYITGNVLDYKTVENCIQQNDSIIISLGFNNSEIDTMSRGTKNILEAMKLRNCKQLVCLSAQGVGDSWQYMPEEFKKMVLNDPILKPSFIDHGIQEELIKKSELEWTIVRPTEIFGQHETKTFSVNNPSKNSIFKISKYDVAQFIIDELFDQKHVGQTVMITN